MDTNKLNSTNSLEDFVIEGDLPVIDSAFQQNLEVNKDEVTSNLFKMFIKSLKESLDEIKQIYRQNKFSLLADRAHYLHGATCYSGVPRLKKAAKHLETASRQERDKKQIGVLLVTLHHEAQLVLEYAKKWAA